jgi:hypothetical protein
MNGRYWPVASAIRQSAAPGHNNEPELSLMVRQLMFLSEMVAYGQKRQIIGAMLPVEGRTRVPFYKLRHRPDGEAMTTMRCRAGKTYKRWKSSR